MNIQFHSFGKLTMLSFFCLAACDDVKEPQAAAPIPEERQAQVEPQAQVERQVQVEPQVLAQAQVVTRTPLNFDLREPFIQENVYTHYFPVETWEPSIAAFREQIGRVPIRGAHEPRLFADLVSRLEQIENIPESLRTLVLDRSNRFLDPESDAFIRFDDLPHGRTPNSGPGFIRTLNHELLNLLVTWKMTGEDQYLDASIEFVEALLKEFPVRLLTDSTAASSGLEINPHGAAELMTALAIAYDLLRGQMDETRHHALAQQLSQYLDIQLERKRSSIAITGLDRARSNWWNPYHNWTAMVSGSMGLTALAIEGDLENYDSMPALWAAYSSMEMWFDKGFEPEGAYLEGNHYVQLGLGSSLPFVEALALRGGPNLYQHPNLAKVLNYVACELLPESPPMRLNAWNTSHYERVGWEYFILMLAGALDQPLGLWIWDNAGVTARLHPLSVFYYPLSMNPVHPLTAGSPLEVFHLRRGLVNLRTGWYPDDFFFSFSSGPFFPTTHGKSDENTFHLYAYGSMFAVDSGAAGYQTDSKSGILINGRGQASSGGGVSVDGFIPAYGNGPAYAYVMGDAKSAYDRNSHQQPGIRVGRADRHVVYVKGNVLSESPMEDAPPYVVIFDDIQHDQGENEYTWLLQSAPGNHFDLHGTATADTSQDGLSVAVWGANGKSSMAVHFFNPTELALGTDRIEGNQRLKVSTRAVNPYFLTVLLPYRAEWENSLPEFSRFAGEGFAGGVLQGEAYTDMLAASWDGPIQNDTIKSDAQMLHVRLDANGDPVSWMVIGATYLKIGEQLLFRHAEAVGLQFSDDRYYPIQANPEHLRD